MSKSPLALAFICCLVGCDEASNSSGRPPDAAATGSDANGLGGTTSSGGSMAPTGSGGSFATGSGGMPAGSGGKAGSGGTSGMGGASSVGGTLGTGGSKASTGGVAGMVAGTGGQLGPGGATGLGGTPGTGGRIGTGGTVSSGGSKGSGGQTTVGGATGAGGATTSALSCNTVLPTPTSKTTVSATVNVSGTKDYNMQQFCADPNALGDGAQGENQKPVFMLAANAVLKNVIIGGSGCSAADGVHCESGSCTLENVWFGDVGEDAITFKGSNASQVMTIKGGGAFSATDKTIQHNGPGTIKVSNFYVNNAGKLYRSCGNCDSQYARHLVLDSITAKSVKSLAGINVNYGDTATFTNITICGGSTVICAKYTGNDTGAEPTSAGSGADGKNCIYATSDITTQ